LQSEELEAPGNIFKVQCFACLLPEKHVTLPPTLVSKEEPTNLKEGTHGKKDCLQKLPSNLEGLHNEIFFYTKIYFDVNLKIK
jgi:hypothetical protein